MTCAVIGVAIYMLAILLLKNYESCLTMRKKSENSVSVDGGFTPISYYV